MHLQNENGAMRNKIKNNMVMCTGAILHTIENQGNEQNEEEGKNEEIE